MSRMGGKDVIIWPASSPPSWKSQPYNCLITLSVAISSAHAPESPRSPIPLVVQASSGSGSALIIPHSSNSRENVSESRIRRLVAQVQPLLIPILLPTGPPNGQGGSPRCDWRCISTNVISVFCNISQIRPFSMANVAKSISTFNDLLLTGCGSPKTIPSRQMES
jgi:hypothetical protein